MSDPLENVQSGDASPLVNRGSTINAVLEAARAHRAAKFGRQGAGPAQADPLTPACLVLVQNDTGSTLPEWGVCTPSGMAVDPEDSEAAGFAARRRPAFTAAAPAAATDPVLIPVEPIAVGAVGRAALAGCTVAVVNVTDAGHRFAVPAAGITASLASANAGPVRLLTPNGVGTYKTYVRIGSPAAGAVWLARLTDESSGGWKYVRLSLTNLGAEEDDGSESDDYTAFPSQIDPSLTCNPMPGMRVLMWESAEPGLQEFMVVLSPPLLCEVTGWDSGTKYHTVEQKTWNTTSDTIVDYSPATSYTQCVNVTDPSTQLANGTRVLMWKIPDVDGAHWISAPAITGAAPALTYVYDALTAPYSVAAADAWEDVEDGGDLEVTVTAGTWRVWYQCSGQASSSADNQSLLKVRVYNETAGAELEPTIMQQYVTMSPGVPIADGLGFAAGNAAAAHIVTVGSSTTYKLQVYLEGSSGEGGSIDLASIHAEKLNVT